MTTSEKIENYFDGFVITDQEQKEHNQLVRKVMRQTKEMIRRESKRNRRLLNEIRI